MYYVDVDGHCCHNSLQVIVKEIIPEDSYKIGHSDSLSANIFANDTVRRRRVC